MSEPAQRLLGTLLGDYWFWRREHLPSAALVDLLREFGLTESAARAAIQRAAARDLVVTSKNGRKTAYGVPERTHRMIINHLRRLLDFGAEDRKWDGRWTFAMFSVPEAQREDRRTLRSRLRWLGFGPLYDGVWVSPWDRTGDALRVLRTLGVGTATVARAEVAEDAPEAGNPLRAWNLDELRKSYLDFLARYADLHARVTAGEAGPAEALAGRTRLMTEWRTFPDADPDLPGELLPVDWPRIRARRRFLDIYDALGPVAEQRFRQIVATHAPDLAELAAHRTSTDITRGAPAEPEAFPPDDDLDWAGPFGQQ
ncbi:PaaX family transcriptional regulator C-terminal domain-containing protein [Amycolatopsis endophytica]|uniref:Phenylacetic acid degradation operon negative regulatory protein n=1 Tax=Amycolatopsis endophytica TaxID=860233 RepID=A0A853BEX1_9PSEU|nr:PaaX family transcriptional regulator C-terminal domain-containing protein [Amycolatopsis endophytica]NYI93315.1 phenylacetic acid degradation operon negative regulatory protein [Amycolatopsis endophytica]